MKRSVIKDQLKHTMKRATPAHLVKTRATAVRIARFAEKVGLVYFGYVNHKADDHRMVRGHTVSRTHRDEHYTVGTVKGYDVSLVIRNDKSKAHPHARHYTLIVALEMRTKDETPHIYIGHKSREAIFSEVFHRMHKVTLDSVFDHYPTDFVQNYVVYASQGEGHDVSLLVGPHIAEVIATHFNAASIEIWDGFVYLYIESEHPSEVLLEKMLSNCLWLGEVIDAIHLSRAALQD